MIGDVLRPWIILALDAWTGPCRPPAPEGAAARGGGGTVSLR